MSDHVQDERYTSVPGMAKSGYLHGRTGGEIGARAGTGSRRLPINRGGH